MSQLIVAALLSAGLGAGVYLVLRGLRPRPIPLTDTIAALHRPATPVRARSDDMADRDDFTDAKQSIGRAGRRLLEAASLVDLGVLEARLRVLDKPVERHIYEKVLGAVAGFVLPNLVVIALAAAGTPTSPVVGLGFALCAAAAGFFYPDLPLAEQVAKRQQAFRHALSSYLDLVTIILAGGGGTESALSGAAEAGDGWAFAEIRSALRRAQLTGQTPWDAFDELGTALDIEELRELAASVSLAGGHGARIRQSLAAKADALRAQLAAELEATAEDRTEKMIVPVTVMVIGLTLFIGFGAIDAISTDGTATFSQPSTTP